MEIETAGKVAEENPVTKLEIAMAKMKKSTKKYKAAVKVKSLHCLFLSEESHSGIFPFHALHNSSLYPHSTQNLTSQYRQLQHALTAYARNLPY